MKKKIQINLKLIVIALLLLVGSYFMIVGASKLSKCEKAISFDELSKSDLKDGVYVCGYIDRYVVRTEMINDKVVNSAVSQTLIDYQGEGDIYTLPIQGDYYIQLMARSDEAKEKLENMLEDTTEKAYFEGIIVKRDIGVNDAWYGAVDDKVYPGINNIISEYFIREVNKDDFWNNLRMGAILAVLAILLFIDGGGFEGLVEETEIKQEIKNVRNLEYVSNKEEELLNRESILRHLIRRQKRIKKRKTSNIIMLVLGLVSFFVIPKLFLIGIILVLFGGKGFLEWFMNSSNIYAIKFAKKIGYDSLYLMIEKYKREIKELEELVYNEEREQGINY